MRTPSGSLWRAFEKRFESYKRVVVEPFFRNHFARLDRQVVLANETLYLNNTDGFAGYGLKKDDP